MKSINLDMQVNTQRNNKFCRIQYFDILKLIVVEKFVMNGILLFIFRIKSFAQWL